MELLKQALLLVTDDASERLATIREYALEQGIELREVSEQALLAEPTADLAGISHLVSVVSDQHVSSYINLCERLGLSLGMVPEAGQLYVHHWFHLPQNSTEAIALAFSASACKVDLLRCNDELVLGMVMLGDTPFIDQRSKVYRNRSHRWLGLWFYRLALFWSSVSRLLSLHPFAVTLSTAHEPNLRTAITGLVVIENDVGGATAKLLGSNLTVQDGRFSALLISPKSVMEYLRFQLLAIIRPQREGGRLPRALSLIRCGELVLEASQPIAYFIDGQRYENTRIVFQLFSGAVLINLSEAYFARVEGKDVHRTENLPRRSERLKVIEDHLPLFAKALEDDFRELFVQLREMAKINGVFISLIILSSIIASLGLFLSSAAVIIGAMVLAPLMAPIISLAMAMVRGDRSMMVQSLRTIGIGMSLAMAMAALLAQFLPTQHITVEMAGRMNPNLLDLGVAIASGIAGAYATVRESVAKSASGVAIAVALVPPLCVVGIGIGWWDWHIVSGAMLLFLTNLVGISLAAALTFLLLGYAPLVRARRSLLVSLCLMLLLAVPLAWSFEGMARVWRIEQLLSSAEFVVEQQSLSLENLVVSLRDEMIIVEGDVLSSKPMPHSDLLQLKQQLSERLGDRLELRLTPRIKL